MRVEVLISCMFQEVPALIVRTNIQSDVLVINQCDEDREEEYSFANKKGEICTARIIHTTERGLSRSRNMALRNSLGDICLICDDDEVLDDNYVDNIIKTYESYPEAAVISFQIHNRHNNRHGSSRSKRLYIWDILRIFSPQITFKRDVILRIKIFFDESLGAGISKGGGEEVLFLRNCLRKKLLLRTEPVFIASLIQGSPSTWFSGYNKEYLIDRGYASKKIVGHTVAMIYNLGWCLKNNTLLEYSIPMSFMYICFGILKK